MNYIRIYLWTLPFILTAEFGSWPEIRIASLFLSKYTYSNMVRYSRTNIIIFLYIMILTCDVVQDWPSTRLRSESKEERSPQLFWVCGTLFPKKEKNLLIHCFFHSDVKQRFMYQNRHCKSHKLPGSPNSYSSKISSKCTRTDRN